MKTSETQIDPTLAHNYTTRLAGKDAGVAAEQPLPGSAPEPEAAPEIEAGLDKPEPPTQAITEPSGASRFEIGESKYTAFAAVLLLFVAIASAAHWSWYPVFVDTYYHMATVQGMLQAGGLPTWAFWEMAPGGRVHIYPPAMHVVGLLVAYLGVKPQTYITFLSWLLYPACLLTTWIWIRNVFGARPALIAVVLLCGPGAFFWNQVSFNAVAFTLTVAPLAFLALERERFLACGVLNLLAATAHPMGLFLPPALVINTVLRRKKWLAGLTAACLPIVLYVPWLAHIWANRAYLPEQRTGSEISLSGIGAGSGLDLGIALGASALLGLGWMLVRRGKSLSLLGPLLGFGVVFGMGFGRRFLQFNLHWPLGCIGAVGVAMLLERLERGAPWRRAAVSIASVAMAFLVLGTWFSLEVRLQRQEVRGPNQGARGGVGPPGEARAPYFSLGASALAKLMDPTSSAMMFGGMGPGGGPGGPGGPGGGPGGQGMGSGGQFRGGGPGGDPGQGGFAGAVPGNQGGVPLGPQGRLNGPPFGMGGGRGPGGQIRGGGRGPGGMDMIHQEGAREFFDAVTRIVAPGEVIQLPEGPAASLVTGVTGRWTTGGILRDVRSANGRVSTEDCHYFAQIGGGVFGGPGPMGPGANATAPENFEKVFENSLGSLWKNPAPPAKLQAKPAVIPTAGLLVLAVVGLALVALDLRWPAGWLRPRLLAGGLAFLVGLGCVAPLGWAAANELRHPPAKSRFSEPDRPFGPPGANRQMQNQQRARAPEPAAVELEVPASLKARHDHLRHRAAGGKPGDAESNWTIANELQFRRLVELSQTNEASALLDQAMEKGKRQGEQ